jgi:hypothetical protein
MDARGGAAIDQAIHNTVRASSVFTRREDNKARTHPSRAMEGNTICTHHGTLIALNCIFSHSHFSWKGLLATAFSSV